MHANIKSRAAYLKYLIGWNGAAVYGNNVGIKTAMSINEHGGFYGVRLDKSSPH